MNIMYKILIMSILVMSLGMARTSGKFSSVDGFFERTGPSHKSLVIKDDRSNNDDGSVKWKRRHKRRKKAPNRRPRRGK